MPAKIRRGAALLMAAVALGATGSGPRADEPRPQSGPSLPGRTLVVTIDGEIDLGLAPHVERVLRDAGPEDLVIFEINTLGGRIDAAILIRDAILGARAQTAAFINRRAISAGALIALGTNTIAMTSGATMGAATPVQIEGGKMAPVEAKVVSYMRKEMRATADARHRRGDIAEAMVDAQVEVPGLDGKETTLTLTTDEALKWKYAAFQAESIADVCHQLGRPLPDGAPAAMNWAERVARVLSDSAISSLLMTLGMLGLMIELWAPGHAVAGVLGVLCLVAFFFGHHVVHLAGMETMLLFAAGAVAIVVDILFWPGLGAIAIGGVLAVFASLVLTLVNVHTVPLAVSLALGWVTSALARVFGSLLLTIAGLAVASRFLPHTRFGKRLVLGAAITDSAGAAASQMVNGDDLADLVGREGLAETTLRPAGKVRIGAQLFDVVSEGGYIEAGTRIAVAEVDGARIVVRQLDGRGDAPVPPGASVPS